MRALSLFARAPLPEHFAVFPPLCCSQTDSDSDRLYGNIDKRGRARVLRATWPRYVGSIYFERELLTRSVEGRRVEMITISDMHGISDEREATVPGLYPNGAQLGGCGGEGQGQGQQGGERESAGCESSLCHSGGNTQRLALKFPEKKYFFLSARVHPGESPAQWMWEVCGVSAVGEGRACWGAGALLTLCRRTNGLW